MQISRERKIAYSIPLSSRAHDVSTYTIRRAIKNLNILVERVGNVDIISARDHKRIGSEIEKRKAAGLHP